VQDLRAKGGPCAEARSAETLTVNKGFLKAGHLPTLIAAFLYFDVSFMVWVLLGPLAVQIAADLHLSAAQKGLMVAVPVLAGALLRVVNGVLVDRIGPKRTGAIGQVIVILGLGAAWWFGISTFAQVLLVGIAPRAPRSASPAPATPARSSRRCLPPASRSPSAGTTCWGWPPCR
jgi:MFS transporter, NNP family, nitrate/nitrite transporter